MALGASAGRIRALVLAQGLGISAAGVAVGLGLALVVARAMRALLFGVVPGDHPVTFVLGGGLLMVVVLVASDLPARRAARAAPSVVPRAE